MRRIASEERYGWAWNLTGWLLVPAVLLPYLFIFWLESRGFWGMWLLGNGSLALLVLFDFHRKPCRFRMHATLLRWIMGEDRSYPAHLKTGWRELVAGGIQFCLMLAPLYGLFPGFFVWRSRGRPPVPMEPEEILGFLILIVIVGAIALREVRRAPLSGELPESLRGRRRASPRSY
jgi:hypothetical protein